jgi:glycosyltransferase involved in cell wall biosynthesis
MQGLPSMAIAPSAAVAANLLPQATSDVMIVRNAVDAVFFEESRTQSGARGDVGLPARGFVIGVPGTLRPVKGHEFFLDAIAPLLRQNQETLVALAGGGHPGFVRSLRDHVERLGISARVVFMGSVSDMAGFYRGCDLVCVPSNTQWMGRTVLEAMAARCPVIATRQEIHEAGIEDWGVCYVRYGHPDELRRAMAALIADDAARLEMTAVAREVAEASFGAEEYQRRIGQIAAQAARMPRT